MAKLRVIDVDLLNPRAGAPTYTSIKQIACYECAEPNATIEAYQLNRTEADDPEVNSRFRARTDACEPVLREIYRIVENERDASQAAGTPFTDNTVLQMRIEPPANRPERLNARRLPILGPAMEYLHDRFLYNRGQCVVTFVRRYETAAIP